MLLVRTKRGLGTEGAITFLAAKGYMLWGRPFVRFKCCLTTESAIARYTEAHCVSSRSRPLGNCSLPVWDCG
jgi:hypothetical protein